MTFPGLIVMLVVVGIVITPFLANQEVGPLYGPDKKNGYGSALLNWAFAAAVVIVLWKISGH